jgi:DNA-binding MarR family transcriptional regulator
LPRTGSIGRLHRLAELLDIELRTVFVSADLGNGDFDLLATLRRAGAPDHRTPGELSASMMVTSGAVTKRVDRLEQRGLVERTVSASDRRGREIRLTDAGRGLVDELVVDHWASEDRLLAALDQDERVQLVALLRKLLLDLEGPG